MTEFNEFNQEIGFHVHDWKPAVFPSKAESLQGEYCTLIPVTTDNLLQYVDALFDALWSNNKGETFTYLPTGPYHELSEFSHFMASLSSGTDTVTYVIIDKKTNSPTGTCSYLRINPEHGSIEVGHIHYSKLLQKSCAATEAMYLMMRNVFENLGYRRYEWKCDSLNELSRKAAIRFGFTFEGVFRQCIIYKGRNRDTAWFSVIDKEWPDKKTRFEKWLHTENFDVDGNQLISLSSL